MYSKKEKVDFTLNKLKKIVKNAVDKENYEKAISAMDSYAAIMYSWNQQYTDFFIEEYIKIIARKKVKVSFLREEVSKKTVLFYDGFGMDTRGLALIYLMALGKLGYKIIYVTCLEAKDNQPNLKSSLNIYDVEWIYCDTYHFMLHLEELQNIFNLFKPAIAFFYTIPHDVVASVVFSAYEDIITRYLINLTDHAFWLGTGAIDYCIEFRNLGASISHNYRNISKDRLVILPYYPYIDNKIKFEGFPFSTKGKKLIFSGGSIYKTFGDKEDTYYKIVDEILEKNLDVLFLYAGSGDTYKLERLSIKYPKRVFIIAERTDLYEVMKLCDLYLNTYPLAGGLMTQFAVVAGKIPITLSPRDGIFDEVLIDQEIRNIEYSNINDLLKDVNRLLVDMEYRKEREDLLTGAVIAEEEFVVQLANILANNKSKYSVNIRECKMEAFQEEYVRRFDLKRILRIYIAQKRKKTLVFEFPLLFLEQVVISMGWKKVK